MAVNIGQLIIGLDGSIVAKINGYITATSQYTNYVQVVAPFDSTDSVSINFYLRNARISNYTQYMTLQRDDSQIPLKGRDVIDSGKEYYQATRDWNVWIVPIDSLALAAISKWHTGTVDVSVTFRSFRNLEIEETGSYIGTFGSRKSITGGDIPTTANIGDFYRCDYLDYYSDISNLEFTLGDLVIYTSNGWIKGIAYETRLSTGSTQFGVDPAIYGQAIESVRLDTTEMIIDRIAGLEAAVLNSDMGGSYADTLYVRNGLNLNYQSIEKSILSDVVYLERNNEGRSITIENLVKELPELDATILRTTGTDTPYEGEGFYAANNVILIGSATEAGISWDGTNLYIRGTIQSGTITDPSLLEELKGDTGEPGLDGQDGQDGYTPILGVDYFNGEDGFSYRFVGTLPLLSSLSLISNPSRNDSYRITETEELWTWTGTVWRNMGVIRGLPGTDGTNGLSSYLHIAYATNSTGTIGFSTSVSLGKTYIGTYRDFTSSDSTDSTKYKWALIKGADGADGTDGINGVSAYLHIAYATNSTGTEGFSTSVSTDKTYIGTYTNSTLADSANPVDYKWTLIKGSDGADGTDGTNGVDSYLHIAYANSADGWTDFATFWIDGLNKYYIGTYTDSNLNDSVTPTDYNWTLLRGSDGADGHDGADGISAYLHIAYATSSDGSTGFSTTVSTDKTYIGTYTNSIVADSEIYTNYSWTLIKGSDGADGTDGTNGVSAYLHIAYAGNADGSLGFTTSDPTSRSYIGTYTDSNSYDSVIPSDYNWSLIKGADGSNGTDGIDGVSAYLHIAYATSSDGSTGFSTATSTDKTYIGQYTNSTAIDSEIYTDYQWTKIVGPSGIDGTNGLQYYLHIAYSWNSTGTLNFSTTDPTGASYIGTYTDTNVEDSEAAYMYTWVKFKGADGIDGADGTSVVLKGSVNTVGDLPTGATLGDLYIVLADGDGYVWNGSTWTNAGPIQGPAGTDGTDGLNAYVHFAYSAASNGSISFSLTPISSSYYIGTYTDFTLADSTNPNDYTWSLYRGIDGQDGQDGTNGLSSYIHYAYSTAADGSTGFSTTWFSGATYVGWYTDFIESDSTSYLDYEWSLFKGADGLDGADGTNGLSAYIHYAYSTSSNGQTEFSTTWFSGATYVGWYTDFTAEDSNIYTDYDWSLFKGQDGVDGTGGTDGLSSYVHYAYATNSTGTTGFSVSWFEGATYVGWYTDFTLADSLDYTDYEWSLFKGSDGLDGEDGIPSYIHYAYATSANGSTGFSTTYTGVENYVGWYTDLIETDSTTYTDYEWSLFKGIDGSNGTDGTNGSSAYIHYAYATSANGSTGFSITWFSGATYVGWYTDFTAEDSNIYTHYEWSLFKGSDGLDGTDGTDGLPSYVHYAYATNSIGSLGFSTIYTGIESYIGWYADFTMEDSVNYTDYEWSLFKGSDGADGDDAEPSKWLLISGSNAYKFLKDSSIPTYTTITLRAESYNLVVSELIWYYSSNDGSTWISTGTTGSTYVNTYNNAIWGTRTSLMFKCVDSTDTYYDIFTIYKLYDGATGIDAVNGYLTNENITFPANSIGLGYSTVEFSGAFKVFYGLTDVTASSTFSITSTNPSGGMTLSIGSSTGIYTLETDNDSWTTDSVTWTLQAVYGSATLTKVFKINKAKAGTDGTDGIDGPTGPGLVFRGEFSALSIYYSTDIRKDVVLYLSNYYSLKPSYNNAIGDWVSGEWDLMTGFASVATDLLLAQNATINKGLVLGSSSSDTTAFMRTFDMESLTSGTGFYIDGTGNMRLGNTSGDNLYWDGSELAIKGNIQADTLSVSTGTIGGWDIGLTNLTAGNPDSLSYSSLSRYLFSIQYKSGGNLIRETKIDDGFMSVGSWDYTYNTAEKITYNARQIKYEHDSGQVADITFDYNGGGGARANMFIDALTDLKNMSIGDYRLDDVIVTGGSTSTISLQTFMIQVDSLRCLVISTGTLTVGSSEGTAYFTLPVDTWLSSSRASVQATMRRESSSGSGVDTVYSNISSTDVVYFTHDYSSSTSNRAIDFTIIGYSLNHL